MMYLICAECGEEEYGCQSKEACIPVSHVRDGINHCFSGEDELHHTCVEGCVITVVVIIIHVHDDMQ